jgi:hypothetical protein
MGLNIVPTRRSLKLNHLSGFLIVLLLFVCSVLLRLLLLHGEGIIVGFVEVFSVEYVQRGGAYCPLGSGKGILRGFVIPAMIGLILYRVFLSTP